MRKASLFFIVLCFLSFYAIGQKKNQRISIVLSKAASERIRFGAERLQQVLNTIGYTVSIQHASSTGKVIVVGKTGDPFFDQLVSAKEGFSRPVKKEGFSIASYLPTTIVAGTDDNGVLYGCLELADQIKSEGKLPQHLSKMEAPSMILRGTCIGLQKTTYLPGRTVYEYPYTPENFPWFYDKTLWIRYLDSMVMNRYNSLYLWNGHPFASLVRLKEYPYAVEVDDTTFQKNEAIYRFITTEANKRGIWVIQMFYNIILSRPFAEKHGLKTQDRARPILPVIADYTRKSIAAFVAKYPNVGLLVTLGEAMEGDETDVEWFTKTIVPGVQDGLKLIGKSEEPPIVLRGHDTNPQLVMKAALPLYKNVYTMNKYNGEALTTYEPRGSWAQMHREMSALGSVHIDNVHILANLEPFRYGSADFIQKSIKAMQSEHHANGVHLYPQASYWDWPYTADKAAERILQIDRDWIWYKAWARYAWNDQRDRKEEIKYWSGLLAQRYGTTENNGSLILKAYEAAGEIAPKLLRRFGITNGNRQTLTLGMLMSQLINPHKYRVWPELYTSDGPEGEMLIDYVAKEWNKEEHKGETPIQIINEVMKHGDEAVDAINRVNNIATRTDEFNRLKNDMNCYKAMAYFFAEKVKAAELVLRYKYSNNVNDLKEALPHLEQSIVHYGQLVQFTKNTYLYANSMQTGQRKIPVGGDGGKNKTWEEVLPYYQKEVERFKRNLDSLQSVSNNVTKGNAAWQPARVTLISTAGPAYKLMKAEVPFIDTAISIANAIAEINELKGIRYNVKQQLAKGSSLTFSTNKPVKLLVGYFDAADKMYLPAPKLETDASANDYGQAAIKVRHAIALTGMPPVNIHAYNFGAGTHSLSLGKGMCLVLGFVEGKQEVKAKGLDESNELDWLFE